MDVIDAINRRKSIRAFKPNPVPREVLARVMESAIRAPSFSNYQPWEFAIVGGKVIAEIGEVLYDKATEDGSIVGHPDIATIPVAEVYRERGRANGKLLYTALGIQRDDLDHRRRYTLSNARFFGAPNGIIIYQDSDLPGWSIFDAGLVAQTIALAAVGYDLGTCIQAAIVARPEELRKILGIPESKRFIVGIAIGYPDWDRPENLYRSPRDPLEKVATWHGF